MTHEDRPVELDCARGLLLGLLLADTVDEWEGDGRLHGTCLTQLACFTTEGMIRAVERGRHKGIWHPPAQVWHAWCRWAHVQGLGSASARQWAAAAPREWPDGWLHQVSPMSARRGSAPATVAALNEPRQWPEAVRPTASAGHHALTRALPLAVFASLVEDLAGLVRGTARLSHGDLAAKAAVAGVVATAGALHEAPEALERLEPLPGAEHPGTAAHALHVGREAVLAGGRFSQVVERARRSGRGPAAVAGALHGALQDASSLHEWLLFCHEVAWVADQLARDAHRELTEGPGDSEWVPAPDPAWSGRYPGW